MADGSTDGIFNNSEVPEQPEFGKGFKQENNGGCCCGAEGCPSKKKVGFLNGDRTQRIVRQNFTRMR